MLTADGSISPRRSPPHRRPSLLGDSFLPLYVRVDRVVFEKMVVEKEESTDYGK